MALTVRWSSVCDNDSSVVFSGASGGTNMPLSAALYNGTEYDRFSGTIDASVWGAYVWVGCNVINGAENFWEFVSLGLSGNGNQTWTYIDNPSYGGAGYQCQLGGNGLNPSGTTTFVIHYNRKAYSISWEFNGGSSSASLESSYMAGVAKTIALPTPTRAGYTFDGWYTDASFSGTRYTASFQIQSTDYGNITFYAKWVSNVTVTFDANGGTVSPASISSTAGATITLPTPAYSPYTFLGWFDGNGALIGMGGASYTIPASATGTIAATAKWNKVTVTFDANGGSVSPASTTGPSGTSITLPTPTRSSSGSTRYIFDGWYDGTSKVTSPYTLPTSNKTLTANWLTQTQDTYSLVARAYGPISYANYTVGTCTKTTVAEASGAVVSHTWTWSLNDSLTHEGLTYTFDHAYMTWSDYSGQHSTNVGQSSSVTVRWDEDKWNVAVPLFVYVAVGNSLLCKNVSYNNNPLVYGTGGKLCYGPKYEAHQY